MACPPSRARRLFAAVAAFAFVACGRSSGPADADRDAPARVTGVAPSAVASIDSPPAPPARPSAPAGYIEVVVHSVTPGEEGGVVLLEDESEDRLLPIFVGGSEAVSLELRFVEKRYQRPLAHDLIDELLARLGGTIIKAQIEDSRGSLFFGRLYVRRDGRVFDVDARPSDAIALALGSGAPIFVAAKVLDGAAIGTAEYLKRESRDDLRKRQRDLEDLVPGLKPPREPLAL